MDNFRSPETTGSGMCYDFNHMQENKIRFETVETYDEDTGVLRMRRVFLNGKLHAPPNGEPSHAAFDKHGRPRHFQWHEHDEEHRTDGPSTIDFFPENGVHRYETFQHHGAPRVPDLGPYIVYRDRNSGEITRSFTIDEWNARFPDDTVEEGPSALEP